MTAPSDPEGPVPNLTYSWLREDGQGIIGDGPPLYSVHEVRAWIAGDGGFVVYARGRMLTRSGDPGPSRAREIDQTYEQPDWLERIIQDAARRLDVTAGAVE